MKMGFDGSIKLEFHGTKVTSNGGLLAHRDLDDALGLFDSFSTQGDSTPADSASWTTA